MSTLGVYSEYGQLREVVVGVFDDFVYPEWSPSVRYAHPELRTLLERQWGKPLNVKEALPERYEKTVAQLDNLAATYQKYQVKVHRPRRYTEEERAYLDNLQGGHALIYPADPVFVLGNHFIELCMRRPYRRKEVFPLRDLLMPLIEEDPEVRYVAMPRASPTKGIGEGPGPFLEGGDIVVHGEDVIVGEGNVCSNRAGTKWLRRYLEPYGYRIHPMPLADLFLHTLGVMCLLREGLLMAYLPALVEGLPAPLADWEVIEITEEECVKLATVGVSLNDRRYLINHRHGRVMDELDKRGIEPIPLETDDISFWGGDIRCSTLPLVRDA